MKHIVYILFSKKLNRYYTGYTTNLDVRMLFHDNAETRKFTAKADDWEIFWTLECETKQQGLLIENHIKRMKSKKYIENLPIYTEISERLLEQYR